MAWMIPAAIGLGVGSLFAGGGNRPESEQKPMLTDEQQQAMATVNDWYQKQFNSGNLGEYSPGRSYGGPYVAPMSSYEQTGLDLLGNTLSGPMPESATWTESAMQNALNRGAYTPTVDLSKYEYSPTAAAPSSLTRDFEEYTSPYLKTLEDKYNTQREEGIKGLEGQLAKYGVTGSPLTEAVRGYSSDTLEGLGDIQSKFLGELARNEVNRGTALGNFNLGIEGLRKSGKEMGLEGALQSDKLSLLGEQIASKERSNALPYAADWAKYMDTGRPLSLIEASQNYGGLPRMLEQGQMSAEQKDWLRTQKELADTIAQYGQFAGTPINFGFPTMYGQSPLEKLLGTGVGLASSWFMGGAPKIF